LIWVKNRKAGFKKVRKVTTRCQGSAVRGKNSRRLRAFMNPRSGSDQQQCQRAVPILSNLRTSNLKTNPTLQWTKSRRILPPMRNHYANNPDAQALLQKWREFISWSLLPKVAPPSTQLDEEIWPGREAAVVRQSAEAGGAYVDSMVWGVPLSLLGKRPGTTVTKHVTNVRNLASRFWRSMPAKPEQRCLVPFTRVAEPKIGAGGMSIGLQ
jgi:putative SOS response-associated peptidase YedK